MTPGKILARIGEVSAQCKAIHRLGSNIWPAPAISHAGVVYLIVGGFAIFAAWGAAQSKGTKGAVLKILKQPFGETLVVILIVGLAGYIMWRLVQSLLDTDNHVLVSERSSDTVGLALECHHLRRFGPLFSLSYRCLCLR